MVGRLVGKRDDRLNVNGDIRLVVVAIIKTKRQTGQFSYRRTSTSAAKFDSGKKHSAPIASLTGRLHRERFEMRFPTLATRPGGLTVSMWVSLL